MITTEESRNADAGAPEPGRGGFMSFWGTLPGVLTALATLVTAVGGIYFASNQNSEQAVPPPAPPPTTQPSEPPVVILPVPISQADLEDVQVDEPALSDLLEGCADGNLADCERLVEELEAACDGGDPYACNDLYQVSPVGSDLEDFGATCGYRLADWSYAGECELY